MITPTALAQFALDVGKATFDNTYYSLATLQSMAEDGVIGVVGRAAWLPDPLKAVFGECVGLLRRTRQDFKHTVDRCYLLLSGREPEGAVQAVPPVGETRARLSVARPARAAASRR
jgi:hypothetical protein